MTKADLIERIAKDAKASKAVAEKALNSMIEAIVKAMKKGDKVTLVGFGTFSVGKRKARMGRNPRTGQAIKIPAHKSPKFSAGKNLKEAVR